MTGMWTAALAFGAFVALAASQLGTAIETALHAAGM